MRIEAIAGFSAEGDVLGVARAMDAGRHPILVNPLGWPVPESLARSTGTDGPERIGITDELIPIKEGIALLRPPSLIVAVSASPTAPADAVENVLVATLAKAGLSRSSIREIVRTDWEETHPTPCETAALLVAGPSGRLMIGERMTEHTRIAIARLHPAERRTITVDTQELARTRSN